MPEEIKKMNGLHMSAKIKAIFRHNRYGLIKLDTLFTIQNLKVMAKLDAERWRTEFCHPRFISHIEGFFEI
jgi:hypothetical protein